MSEPVINCTACVEKRTKVKIEWLFVVERHAFVFNHLVQEKSGLSQLLLDALVLFVDEGFSFRNFLVDVFTVFVFIAWFWLLITVFMDRSGVMISQAGRKQSGS